MLLSLLHFACSTNALSLATCKVSGWSTPSTTRSFSSSNEILVTSFRYRRVLSVSAPFRPAAAISTSLKDARKQACPALQQTTTRHFVVSDDEFIELEGSLTKHARAETTDWWIDRNRQSSQAAETNHFGGMLLLTLLILACPHGRSSLKKKMLETPSARRQARIRLHRLLSR